jgi:putative transposase
MQLVERHVINKDHEFWSECDQICFLSKNLYNYANYQIRQHFFKTGQILNFYDVYKLVSQSPDYKALPTKVSKQIIRRLDKNWVSWKATIFEYKKNPHKFTGCPKLPKYKDKEKGRNIAPYPHDAISVVALRKGFASLSKSNISLKTQRSKINEVRIIPQSCCYVIEIVYTVEPPELNNKEPIASIDLGLNNLMAVTTNQSGIKPLLVNGQPLKSINQFYNKRKSKLQSKSATSQINALTHKRNCRVENYLHTASRRVIQWCQKYQIGTLIIGKNEGGKDSINIGRKNNQQFTCIPHTRLIQMLTYKAELAGIKVILTEESYTSKASALDNDFLPVYGENTPKFSGKRVKRGLYQTSNGCLINADVNGCLNIGRKVIPNYVEGIGGRPCVPWVLNPLRTLITRFL